MGRPRQYLTPEARNAANRAKSQRSYERNKLQIAERRSRKRELKKKKSRLTPPDPATPLVALTPDGDRNVHIVYWMERSQRVVTKLARLTGGSSATFVDRICQQYLAAEDKDIINDAVICASRLTRSIQRYHDEVLQLVGVGTELATVSEIEGNVRELTRWLEELLCTAMVDHGEFIHTYNARRFMFQ